MDGPGFDAFISYSHRDMKWGRWIQRRLETLHVPREISKERPGSGKLRIFRDQTDLAGSELQASLKRELDASRFLIVICSPSSAASQWVNEEIRYFISLGRRSRIIPFIVSGEPSSDRPELECFPPALRSDGEEELLGANIQEIGKDKAFLKVAAILLDVRFNRLVDREKQRRIRTGIGAAAVILTAAAVTGTLLWRNAVISKKNRELSFDIYGAALLSLAEKDSLEPEELAFLRTSAEAGNTDAMIFLADCCLKGVGGPVDEEEAFRWYREAADRGVTTGMIGAANCYMHGTGVEADPAQVFAMNLRAAESGDAAGMVNAASCLEDGFGTAQDPEGAFRWYTRAAEAGYDLGMYNLARCFRGGVGTEADPSKAFFWMKKLAETGNQEGMYNLALMYQFSYGTEEDPRQAYEWYRRAADAGCAPAMRMVGWCIENSYGTGDPALEWYRRAYDAGDPEAMEEIKRITGEP